MQRKTLFEKLINEKRPESTKESESFPFEEWAKLDAESTEFIERSKNRKPLVEFYVELKHKNERKCYCG